MRFDEIDIEPTVELSKTKDLVARILVDADFAKEVAVHNRWDGNLPAAHVALLLLSARFNWAVELLSRQTATLLNLTNTSLARTAQLEDR